ncbi:MAG: translation initiation factor IF-2 [Gammaproteobacteria bacterium]
MANILVIAKKYGKTVPEVKAALLAIGCGATVVPKAAEEKLAAHFSAGKHPAAKSARGGAARTIGGTQVVEKKRRTFTRPPKPSAILPAAKPAAEAKPPAPKPADAEAMRAANTLYEKQIAAQKSAKSPAKPAPVKSAATSAETTAATDSAKTATASAPATAPAVAAGAKTAADAPAKAAETETPSSEKTSRRRKTIKIDRKIVQDREKRRRQKMSGGKRPPANQHGFKQPVGLVVRELPIPEVISVSRLASEMAVKSGAIIRKLMDYGIEDAGANMQLDRKTAWVLVEEFGHKPAVLAEEEDPEKEMLKHRVSESDALKEPRSPVVTIMGHVDHGKTSLLDYIRKTRVAGGEAGGITQHIGAYQVENPAGNITFLDTPGHALFTQMRARGAQITDLVVLVVAGDDGVRPQTEEAVAHAQAAGVPLVVAVNKMDKPGFDMERVKNELSGRGVIPEDWGGDAMMVAISAQTGEGVDKLLDAVRTQSDLLELKAALAVPANAVAVEARIDRGRGALTTVIVREGVLRCNDYVVCGTESGRVRAMWDSAHRMLDEAGPSMPAEIQGLSGLPEVGEDLVAVQDERKAREVAGLRQERRRAKMLSARSLTRPVSMILNDESAQKTELNVIVKADVGGSREALAAALSSLSGKKAAIKVIHSAVGGVSESDVNLARAGNALIIAFNVRPDAKSRKLAQSCGIKILQGNVIYEIIDRAKEAVLDLLDAEREEKIIGMAEVLKVFSITKVGNIAGCRVADGVIRADARARLVRDGAIVYEGDIGSLRHFKEQAEEVRNGEECGIAIRRFNDIKTGDIIEAVQVIETPPTF